MIHSENLVHEYSRRDEEGNVTGILRAVDGVSIDVKDGDFIAILGANGSGKSTFAKHLNRLLVPTEGTLYIDGKDALDAGNTLAIRQTAGMVFQNPDNQIISNIVEEDVGFGPENMGVPTQEILKRVEECLKEVGMYSYRRRSPNHLSGGQKQRVAIAGIMAMRPKCIILDEATAMLDPVGRKKVLDTVHKLNRDEKITIIMITHYMEEAADADYIYVMNHGKVRMEGTPREVFVQKEKLEECRLELPEISQIANGLRERGIMVPADVLDQIIEAGTFAANGRGLQSPIIIAVTNKEMRDKIMEMNRKIGGWEEGFDPFYGAPVILIVLADASCPTAVYDGSLTMGNLMLAAHDLGIGSCWIHRAKEEFESEEGKQILEGLGITGNYIGVGHCALGFTDGAYPDVIPRKDNRVYYIR